MESLQNGIEGSAVEKLFKEQVKAFSKELQLLLKFIKDDSEINKVNKECFENINWKMFIKLAKHHRVFPLIYRKLKRLSENNIPVSVLEELSVDYQKNIFRMLQLSGETEHVAKLFAANNIKTLFLKGPVLAVDLYGDISLRTSADLDILIPIDKLSQAENILLEQGYIKDDYIHSILNDWKWRHHHITFHHPIKKIKVEIHWRLNPGPAKEPRFQDLWNRKRISTLTNYPVYMLGKEDLFLFLVSHGARHGWSRLRWLVDINKITNCGLNWIILIDLLRKYHYFHIGGQAILLLKHLLGCKPIGDMNHLIKGKRTKQLALNALFYIKQMINLHSEGLPQEVAAYHKRHLFSLMAIQQKIFFILSFLFPYPEDAQFFPLPKFLHFLYFPLRPLLLVLRKTRNHLVTRRV